MSARTLYGKTENFRQRTRWPALNNKAARRFRAVKRLTDAPDAAASLAMLLALLERQLGVDRGHIDRLLDGIIDAPTERVALFAQIEGGR